MSDLFLNELEKNLHLPIPLGSFARVLVDYHRNWLVDPRFHKYGEQLDQAEKSYIHEYASSTGGRSRTIGSVGRRNYNRELNELNGKIVARLASKLDGPINLMDIGGGDGITTELAYMEMERRWLEEGRGVKDLRERLNLTFVEPSQGMMADAVERLSKLDLRHRTLNIPAHEIVNEIEAESQHI